MTITYKKEVDFKGKLYKEIFYKKESAFGIALMWTDNDIEQVQNGMVQIIGTFNQLEEGIEYSIKGELQRDARYGWQYKVISIYCDALHDADTMKNYLYAILPKDRTDVLLTQYPDLVDNIIKDVDFEPNYDVLPGIGKKTFLKIKDKILDTYLISELLALLSPIGVSFAMIKRIAEGESDVSLLKSKILDNPYLLTKVNMLSFKKVDKFALELHPDFKFSNFRMISALEYALEEMGEEDGHSWVDINKLKARVKILTPEVIDLFDKFIAEEKQNTIDGKSNVLYIDEHRCGLYKTYNMEKFIYEKLKNINSVENKLYLKNFEENIINVNKELGFDLSEQQSNIIKSIFENNITVISGKAGVGKSTLIKGILGVYHDHNFSICTLSAKAARRVVEVTNFKDAKTIHRLLEYNPSSGFQNDEKNPLTCDFLIVDEASMVNTYLFYSLLKAVPDKCKVIITGDNMQLPSIGSGAIFTDLLSSKLDFSTLNLTKIYRQAELSGIVMDANKIRDGILPFKEGKSQIISGEKQDMIYLFKTTKEIINQSIVNIFMKYIESGVDVKDISILLPRKDNCTNSTRVINSQIQELIIPKMTQFIEIGREKNKRVFKIGDRVLNTTNNYKKDVMNGEIGTVLEINGDSILIDFDEKKIELSREELEGLELGYALTVHKMQGSSSKYVIIGIDNSHRMLLSSNLIYTAITRSEKKCIVVAQLSAFKFGVKNTQENKRQTFLQDFLK